MHDNYNGNSAWNGIMYLVTSHFLIEPLFMLEFSCVNEYQKAFIFKA